MICIKDFNYQANRIYLWKLLLEFITITIPKEKISNSEKQLNFND